MQQQLRELQLQLEGERRERLAERTQQADHVRAIERQLQERDRREQREAMAKLETRVALREQAQAAALREQALRTELLLERQANAQRAVLVEAKAEMRVQMQRMEMQTLMMQIRELQQQRAVVSNLPPPQRIKAAAEAPEPAAQRSEIGQRQTAAHELVADHHSHQLLRLGYRAERRNAGVHGGGPAWSERAVLDDEAAACGLRRSGGCRMPLAAG